MSNWHIKEDGSVIEEPEYFVSVLRHPLRCLRFYLIGLLAGKTSCVVINAKINYDRYVVQFGDTAKCGLILNNEINAEGMKAGIVLGRTP